MKPSLCSLEGVEEVHSRAWRLGSKRCGSNCREFREMDGKEIRMRGSESYTESKHSAGSGLQLRDVVLKDEGQG